MAGWLFPRPGALSPPTDKTFERLPWLKIEECVVVAVPVKLVVYSCIVGTYVGYIVLLLRASIMEPVRGRFGGGDGAR